MIKKKKVLSVVESVGHLSNQMFVCLFVIARGILFQVLFNLVSWAFPEFKFSWLVKETKRNIPIELDFLHEGRNAEKVEKMFSHLPWLKVWHLN